jgi:LPXTG-motif cell wall-anchored protein
LPNTGGNTDAYLLLAFVLFGAAAVFTMGGRKLQRV